MINKLDTSSDKTDSISKRGRVLGVKIICLVKVFFEELWTVGLTVSFKTDKSMTLALPVVHANVQAAFLLSFLDEKNKTDSRHQISTLTFFSVSPATCDRNGITEGA